MEFVIRDCDRKISLCFPARSETRKEFGVEQRDPNCLGGGAPVEKCKECSCGVVDTRILGLLLVGERWLEISKEMTYTVVGEEYAFQNRIVWECDYIFALANFVSFDVVDGI